MAVATLLVARVLVANVGVEGERFWESPARWSQFHMVRRSQTCAAFVHLETDYVQSLAALSQNSVSAGSGVSAMENGVLE